MPKFFLSISFLVISSFCFAQKHNDYFLKNNGEHVDNIDSADFIRIVSEPDSGSKLYNVLEFYKNKKPKLVGKSSQIDFPSYEGKVLTYFENGHKKSISSYLGGRLIGLEYKYYPNGKLYMVNEFPDTSISLRAKLLPNQINECYDTLGNVLTINGSGYIKIYDEDFRYVYEEGRIKNVLKDSVWKGTDKKLGIHFTEIYKDGELLSGTGVDDNGISIAYQKSRETIPLFNGGMGEFFRYLSRKIVYPAEAREKNIQGKVILKFIVTKLGKITNITIIQSAGKSLDEEAIRLIKNSPDWIPGTKFGHVTNATYTVPMGFILDNMSR